MCTGTCTFLFFLPRHKHWSKMFILSYSKEKFFMLFLVAQQYWDLLYRIHCQKSKILNMKVLHSALYTIIMYLDTHVGIYIVFIHTYLCKCMHSMYITIFFSLIHMMVHNSLATMSANIQKCSLTSGRGLHNIT